MCATQRTLHAFIDALDDEILILNTTGTILALNNALVATWGGSKEDYIGLDCRKFFLHKISGADIYAFFKTVIESGQEVIKNYTTLTKDGLLGHYILQIFPFLDETDPVQRVAITRKNITAQVQLEQRMSQLQKMASIGEFANYIVHEIRNPLFIIGGFAQKLSRTVSLDDKVREKAQAILTESQRLDGLLKNIIMFSRPAEETIAFTDCNEVITQTVALMDIGCKEQHITLTVEEGPNVPKVHCPPDKLKQCLINLIKNAMEALGIGGRIHVRSTFSGGMVYIEVEDNGPGIPFAEQDNVFLPFFTTKNGGSGLGLAITRKVILELGGEIRLCSKPGQGTLFSLALTPVLATAAANPDGPSSILDGEKRFFEQGRSPR